MKKKVIITDDDNAMQDALRLIFERAGYEATIYANGNSLLNNGHELPDIYILDKQLSGVDGLDICRHLKAQARSSNIPVIMLSATPNIAKLAIEAGAAAFLEKPFKMRDLLELTAAHVDAIQEA